MLLLGQNVADPEQIEKVLGFRIRKVRGQRAKLYGSGTEGKNGGDLYLDLVERQNDKNPKAKY